MLDDRVLIERFQNGDRRAFDELVRRHYRRAYNLAYRILGDPEEAADATQAAFIRVYRGLAGYRHTAAFTTWLHRIVVNVSLDQARRGVRGASLERPAQEDGQPIEARIASDEMTPEERVAQAERAQLVQQVLMELPPMHRAVLTLYEIQGLSYEEIARVLGVPVGTVKSRLNRARAAFARAFSKYEEHFR